MPSSPTSSAFGTRRGDDIWESPHLPCVCGGNSEDSARRCRASRRIDPWHPVLVVASAAGEAPRARRRRRSDSKQRLRRAPGVSGASLMSGRGLVLVYHRIASLKPDTHGLCTPRDIFESHMTYVAEHCDARLAAGHRFSRRTRTAVLPRGRRHIRRRLPRQPGSRITNPLSSRDPGNILRERETSGWTRSGKACGIRWSESLPVKNLFPARLRVVVDGTELDLPTGSEAAAR